MPPARVSSPLLFTADAPRTTGLGPTPRSTPWDLVLSARPGLRSAARRLTIHLSPVALSLSLKYENIWHVAIRIQSPEARPKKETA